MYFQHNWIKYFINSYMWFKLEQLSVKLQENSNNLITARHNFVTRKSKNTTEKNIAESFGILK